jgi:hypothetical protein
MDGLVGPRRRRAGGWQELVAFFAKVAEELEGRPDDARQEAYRALVAQAQNELATSL